MNQMLIQMSMDTNWGNCVDKIWDPDIPSQYLHTICYQSPGQSQEICQLSKIIQNLVQFRDNPRLLFSRPLPAFHHLRRLSNQSAVRQNSKSSHLTFLNRNWLYLAGKYYSAPVLCQKNSQTRKSSFPIIICKSLWKLCSLLLSCLLVAKLTGFYWKLIFQFVSSLSRLTGLGEKASQARHIWTFYQPASQPTARQFCSREMNCWLKSHD